MACVAYRAPPGRPRPVASGVIVFAGTLVLSACVDGTRALAPPDAPDPTVEAASFVADAAERIPAVIASLEDLRTWFLPATSHELTGRITPAVRAVEVSLEAADARRVQEGLGRLVSEMAGTDLRAGGPEGLIALDVVEITARATGQLLGEPAPLFEILESRAAVVSVVPGNMGGTS